MRGPGYEAHAADTNLTPHWPAAGPPVLWTRDLGAGYLAFVAAEGRAYTGGYQPWDQDSNLEGGHAQNALAADRPIVGLPDDLRVRGLLDDTLVIWGGEFGRTPAAEGADGRDHHPYGYTMWLAGGGVKGGMTYGATDEVGWDAVRDRVHVHDLHATILHLLGLDHERLTYGHAGRDYRLTDVSGRVVTEIVRG